MRRLFAMLGFVALLAVVAWVAVSQLSAPLSPASSETSGVEPTTEVDSADDAPAAGADPAPVPLGAEPATVEYVHDGDTVFLTDGRKVRLLGINTPEIGDDAECYGSQARDELREWLPDGTDVWVLSDVEPLDQYGRSLLWIFLGDGTNVNLELVSVGVAEVEQYAPNWLYRDELRAAEDAAYSEGLGMWSACR